MKLIADVHISPLTVAEIRGLGNDIQRVTEFLASDATDMEIIELARRKDAVIVTQDLDFSALIAKDGLSLPSVISLRVGDAKPTTISNILISILPLIKKDLEEGAIVSVEEEKFRVRKLPISKIISE